MFVTSHYFFGTSHFCFFCVGRRQRVVSLCKTLSQILYYEKAGGRCYKVLTNNLPLRCALHSFSTMVLDDETKAAINYLWVLVAGIFCFFLAAGFGLLEAGSVREKNVQNILLKVSLR